MKLLSFKPSETAEPQFGIVINDTAVSFDTLQKRFGQDHPQLKNIYSYLQAFPASEDLARELMQKGEKDFASLKNDEKFPLDKIKILPAVPRPAALFDFGLTPKHLRNSAITMAKYETKWPISKLAKLPIRIKFNRLKKKKDFIYYKCNHESIIGDMDSPIWPKYASYFDIEPELGIVTGPVPFETPKQDVEKLIAGYVIFNDFSARDIQTPEMMQFMGPARSKDFERGNAFGPFLVTKDEVGDPLNLNVTIKVGERYTWNGTTSDIIAHPREVIEFITGFRSLSPGTVIGMGTIPYCCGLDNDQWLEPGDFIQITFEKLGTLHHPIPTNIGPLKPTRWKPRKGF
jgi:2-keto-4-pentenoate hydratase/2-oxohepta-3-ene-1,7-dioic acid hydratase in catechol pathway